MKVLHIYSGNLWGGVESMLKTLASYGQKIDNFQQEFALCRDQLSSYGPKRALELCDPIQQITKVRDYIQWAVNLE